VNAWISVLSVTSCSKGEQVRGSGTSWSGLEQEATEGTEERSEFIDLRFLGYLLPSSGATEAPEVWTLTPSAAIVV
jgi:hypothetical protein